MADISTLARPYAKAVFELAQAEGRFEDWQKMLDTLAAVAANEDIQFMLKDPRVSTEVQAEVFLKAAGDVLDAKGANFVRVLAKYRRLAVLPAIAEDYTALRADAENSVQAELRTAVEASDAQVAAIKAALAKRLGRDVELKTSVDASIVGGAIVRAGDFVIDDSVQGKLERLAVRIAS
ncbi:MAG: F0F1 ATP synthase subunit delta [Gammaproteobacteria bacterium]|nr:F0F1 ATP synthase subunit delta [Gammaproteobacteria bacterium]